jgi:hypothetical protein
MSMTMRRRCRSLGVVLGFGAACLRAGDLDVVLNEVHYHPFGDDASLEFVEILNAGPGAVDLGGWSFQEGILFLIPPGTVLEGGRHLVVAADAAALRAAHPGVRVVGDYDGRLDNSGEVLVLVDARGREVSRVHYGDGGAWSSLADGGGPSLELMLPRGDIDRPQLWKSSRRLGGTPGAPNTRGPAEIPFTGTDDTPALAINEVKPASGPGDAGFIELWNAGPGIASLAGYSLVDTWGQTRVLPAGSAIGGGSFLVLPASALGFSPAPNATYALLEPGGVTIADSLDVAISRTDLGCGRHPDGARDAYVSAPTPGAPNVFTPEDAVVIHEIFFAPLFEPAAGACLRDCSDHRQWIELHNRSGATIDITGWRLDRAVEYAFRPGSVIPAGGFMVVAASRAAFESDHPGVALAPGEWTGSLGRRSDTILLRDAVGNPADRVQYGNGSPVNDVSPEDGRDDRTLASSDWPPEVADSGRSIELAHPLLENAAGRSWRLGPADGTPGAPNSTAEADPPPVVDGVSHAPAVPSSSDHVLVTARAHAAGPVSSVEVVWRIEGEAGTQSLFLKDDGLSGEGLAGDSLFGGLIPPAPDGSVISFEVTVTAASGGSATYPVRPAVGNRPPRYLYEVDDEPSLGNGSVDYRVIMTRADLNALRTRPLESDVLLPATFIADGAVHHLVGVRYRGENTRGLPRKSYRVEFRPERRFQGLEVLNLNASNRVDNLEMSSVNDFLAADIFRRSGMPSIQEWPVNLHFQGGVQGDLQGRTGVDPFYIRKEHFHRDFLARYFGGSDRGNLYRPLDPPPPGGGQTGDLSYRGEDPASYAPLYEKRSNRDENDYSDLIELTRAFDSQRTPDADFADAMYGLLDVDQWARFFAIQDFLNNIDGGIQTNNGEDYFLYHVPYDSPRPDAGLWLILPWDLEETFSNPGADFFITSVAAARRFIRHPEFAPLYLASLNEISRLQASRAEVLERCSYVDDIYDAGDAGRIKARYEAYLTSRSQAVSNRIVSGIDAGLSMSGAAGEEVIAAGDLWSYWKGTEEPPGGALEWTELAYPDEDWPEGPSGFGYGDGDDATVLDDMRDGFQGPGYSSLYVRRVFDVTDPSLWSEVSLVVDYDDAFVAYLNGVEVARSAGVAGVGTPGEPIPFDLELGNGVNHEASGGDNNPNPPETFTVAGARDILRPGLNVIAIQGLNSTRDSSDFSLIPSLVVRGAESAVAAGWGSELFASAGSITLAGSADPSGAASLRVNGLLAEITSRPPGGGTPYRLEWRSRFSVAPGPNAVRIESFSRIDGTGAVRGTLDITVHGIAGPLRQVGGMVSGVTVWRKEEGPYLADSTVTIPFDASLVIEAGTRVLFGRRASIIATGPLEIRGTAEDPVILGAATLGGRWGGIAFTGTGTADASPTHRLVHARLELASTPQQLGGAVSVDGSKLVLEDLWITRASGIGIDARGARVDMAGCVIEDAWGGIRSTGSTLRIADSVVKRLTSADAIFLQGNGPERSRIERCLLEGSLDDGIELLSASADLVANVIRFVADRGISVGGSGGGLGPALIEGNLIHDASVGLELEDDPGAAEGYHDTLVACRKGLVVRGDGAQAGLPAVFHSMIIWGNAVNLDVPGGPVLDLTWSDVGGDVMHPPPVEGIWPGSGNIRVEPGFTDPGRRDYRLASSSPCRGAGKDGTDMGAGGVVPGGRRFIRGDTTGDSVVNLTDGIVILTYLFLSGSEPACLDAADTDDSGIVDLTDPIFLLDHLFRGGLPIAPPFPEAGRDGTVDELSCEG